MHLTLRYLSFKLVNRNSHICLSHNALHYVWRMPLPKIEGAKLWHVSSTSIHITLLCSAIYFINISKKSEKSGKRLSRYNDLVTAQWIVSSTPEIQIFSYLNKIPCFTLQVFHCKLIEIVTVNWKTYSLLL